ncbi:hypothetical protein GCM10007867_07060 [Gluconobacter cerinus]|uniref:Uncharacterized protein n=1 Tax=Gluconobacter cerinus TaxID=38307 RepID=A0AAV5NBS8_9PROT|nr:hypothetical protein GCM10007867_07060 [Gluconobacter cerinus]
MIYRWNVAKHVKACEKDTSGVRDLPCVLFLMSVRGNYSPSEVALDYVTFSLWERVSSDRDQVLSGTKIVLQQEKPKGYVSVPI